MKKNNTILLLWFALLSFSFEATAQKTLLDQPLSIKIENEKLEDALKMIAAKADFSFSYNPTQFDLGRTINLNVQNKSLRQILDDIFRGTASYKEKQGYVILQKIDQNKTVIVNGYIYDQLTGEKIAQASIFERHTLISAISNSYGYYRIKLPVAMASARLEVRKEQYTNKSIAINDRTTIDILLNPVEIQRPVYQPISLVEPNSQLDTGTQSVKASIPEKLKITAIQTDTVVRRTQPKPQITNWRSFVDVLTSAQQQIVIGNIKDTLYRSFQISLLPFIGTNHRLSGNVINNLSINVIGGYALGVNGLEIGNVFNLIRRDVHGLQMAGVVNLVGRDVSGLQMAGTVNVVGQNVSGTQMAGTVNVVGRDVSGLQMAGVVNVVGHNFKRGLQMAGTVNVVLNSLSGTQMSGLFNYARVHKRGLQLGFINYADSSGGIPLGLVSYVRKNGYRRLEFSTDELNYFNISIKTGVRRLYNIFTVGFNFLEADKPYLSVGYGLGTAFELGKNWAVNIDAVANKPIINTQYPFDDFTQHYRIGLAIEKKLTKQVALFAGTSANWLISRTDIVNTDKSSIYALFPTRVFNGGGVLSGWWGFQAGIRVCNKVW
jgi:hypothetical protein